LPLGPVALARAANVLLVPVFNFREGVRSSRLVIRPAVAIARTTDRDTDLQTAADQLAREIEWAIRERPHQWFCFRRLWD
jgi:lauroyl/myristoyl acyltransferase